MPQDKSLKGKHIVLGITGSIAAYKACTLIRLLIKAGAEVQVVITPAGKEFITPITLSALTSKPVISDFFAQRDGTWHSHVALGQWADAMIIAPATASTIGKMANGIADIETIEAAYRDFYRDAAFTHYVDKAIDLKQVVNTNKALVHCDKYGDKLLITSCIDNLLKGAVGQAVQNMNLMFGLDERAGLRLKPSAF